MTLASYLIGDGSALYIRVSRQRSRFHSTPTHGECPHAASISSVGTRVYLSEADVLRKYACEQ
jgi:hypothetical protein